MAYHGLAAVASERLLQRDFGSRLRGANPAATVARAGKLMRYVGDYRALVRTPRKRVEMIASTVPLVASSGGSERPVDLSLRSAGGAFAAVNPLERVTISRRLGGGVAVGSEGIRVLAEGADVSGTVVAGQSVFFANVGPDEDVSVEPRLEGADLSTVLRSRLSPQQVVYRVALPAGATLTGHAGGAIVARAGRVIAEVPAPTAVDAQDSFVPVRMQVAGDRLVLSVQHGSREVAYPILVDPRIVTYEVKTGTRGWHYLSCEAEHGGPDEAGSCEGEATRGPALAAPNPGTLIAPAADYGHGEVTEWITAQQRLEEDPSISEFEYVFFEPWYSPYAEWYWSGLGKHRGRPEATEVTYEGVTLTPGEFPSEKEQEHGTYGTGWWNYTVGCAGGSNREAAPPETVVSRNTSGSCPWPSMSLRLREPPRQGVWWPPPKGLGFGVRVAPTQVPTTLSIEAAVVVEGRSPHRRRGRRRRELLGSENASEPNRRYTCEKDPVNCATGNLTETQTDFNVPGRGAGLTLARTYNSQAASTPGPFGYGWSWSFGAHLSHQETFQEGETDTQTVEQANGSTVVFTTKGLQTTTEPGVQATLTDASGDKPTTYTLPNQDVLQFGLGGELVSETDRNGNVTTVTETCEERERGGGGAEVLTRGSAPDGDGRCLRSHLEVTDPAGRTLTLYKNSEGLVERATDPMGHTVTYGYENGNLVSVTEPGESTPRWRFAYDSEHRMTAMTDGTGGTTTNAYDAENRVISQTDPGGDTRRFEYKEEGGTELEGATGVGTETGEEEDLPEVSEEEEEIIGTGEIGGGSVSSVVEPLTFTTRITDEASGAVRLERFNEEYELTSITDGAGTSDAATRAFGYDSAGDMTREKDADGHTTSYEYDAEGNKTSETNAVGDETHWTYDSTHDVIAETAPSGETTTITRDEHGNALEVSRPAPGGETQTTKYVYDPDGALIAMKDPLGNTWKYEYDADGDRIAEIDPEGDKRTFAYNEDSQEISTTSPRGNVPGAEAARYTTVIERDAQGRVVRVIEPLE
jgi:YD repeat-containing protein